MSKRGRDEVDDGGDAASSNFSTPNAATASIECTFPPCHSTRKTFQSYEAYETHVLGFHSYVCQQCRCRFPTETFLEIHIDENHNPFFQIAKEQGKKVYKCLHFNDATGGCTKRCADRKKRRLHMIDKHGYPRDFNFGVIDRGLS